MSHVAEELSKITQTYENAAVHYLEGAEKVDDARLKVLFTSLAEVRKVAKGQLDQYIDGRGEAIIDSETLLNKMRRTLTEVDTWINDDAESYLADLEEQEDRTLDALNHAIQKSIMPPNVLATLKAQREVFEQTHFKMRSLKHQYDA